MIAALQGAQHVERQIAEDKTAYVVVAADGRVLACVIEKSHDDELPLAELARRTYLPLMEIPFARCRRSDSRTPRALCLSLLKDALDGVKLCQ